MAYTTQRWRWVESPWVQGVAGGALALIPARRWPAWVRVGYTWVPAVAAASLVAVPQAWKGLLPDQEPEASRDTTRTKPAGHIGVGERDLEGVRERAIQELDAEGARTTAQLGSRVVVAAAIGGMVYGVAKLSLWADTALEDGLRRMKVPAPRVTLAIAAGLTTGWIASVEGERPAGGPSARADRDDDDSGVGNYSDLDDADSDDGLPDDD